MSSSTNLYPPHRGIGMVQRHDNKRMKNSLNIKTIQHSKKGPKTKLWNNTHCKAMDGVYIPYIFTALTANNETHDDVIKWKPFPRYWPFVRGIQRSPANSPHKGQWRGTLMFSLICPWIDGWVNNREADDLRRHHAHYDVIIMQTFDNFAHTCCCARRHHNESQYDATLHFWEFEANVMWPTIVLYIPSPPFSLSASTEYINR